MEYAACLSLLVAPPGELRTQQRAPGATIRQAHTESLETKTATRSTYHGFVRSGRSPGISGTAATNAVSPSASSRSAGRTVAESRT